MDGAALAVAKHLDFDVARPLKVFFQIHCVVAERCLGFAARRCERNAEIGLRVRDLHAAPAAARGRLDQHGKTDAARKLARLALGGDTAVGARHHRNAEAHRRALGFDLVAHQADVFGPRPDEVHVVLAEDFGKARVLGQESAR